MNIINEARTTLESAGYVTVTAKTSETFYFEDESLFGCAWVMSSVGEILGNWEQRQDKFLLEKDVQLRQSKEKSWNAYCVFLTEGDPTPAEKNKLLIIEENFRGTRKIAFASVRTTTDLTHALLPLLPIQSLVQLGETDVLARLRLRLGSLPESSIDTLLGDADAREATQALLRSDEDS